MAGRPRIWASLEAKVAVYNAKPKVKLFAILGNKCNRCGYSDLRALQLDHKNRSNEPRNSTLRSGRGLYNAILQGRFPLTDFQLLCANCNWIKKIENKEFKPVNLGLSSYSPQESVI